MALSMTLQPLLSSKVALDNLLRDVPSRRGEVTPCPEGREATQHRILLAEMMRRESFALLNHLCCRVGRPDAHEEMDVIWLNRQFENCPSLLGTLLFDEGLAVLGDSATQYRFAALRTPDQVVDDKVDAVFISLVFHVDIVVYNNMYFYRESLDGRLKPEKAPNLWGSIPEACGGLKSVSVSNRKRLWPCSPGTLREPLTFRHPDPPLHLLPSRLGGDRHRSEYCTEDRRSYLVGCP